MRRTLIVLSLMLYSTIAHAGIRFEALPPLDASSQQFAMNGIQLSQADGQSGGKVYTYLEGVMRGETAAKSTHSTGASLAGGLAWGFTLGFIGAGIGYFTTGTSDPSARDMFRMEGKGSDFREGFIDGYRDKARSKNKSAKLGGGLLGALFALALVFG